MAEGNSFQTDNALGSPENNRQYTSSSLSQSLIKKHLVLIILSLVVILSATIVIVWASSFSKDNYPKSPPPAEPILVDKKEEPLSITPLDIPTEVRYIVTSKHIETGDQNGWKGEVFLKNTDTNEEIYFGTFLNLASERGEYHNGHIYLNLAGMSSDKLVERYQLWRYNFNGEGKRLYTTISRFSFSVSSDEKFIAVVEKTYIGAAVTTLKILDGEGVVIKSFSGDEIIIYPKNYSSSSKDNNFYYEIGDIRGWSKDYVWFSNNITYAIGGFIKINLDTFLVTKYDLTTLDLDNEIDLNPEKGVIAYSDFPPTPVMEESEIEKYFQGNGGKVTLQIYDLNSKSKRIIDTSIKKNFYPKWIDSITLEYNDPNSDGRISKQIF